MKVRVGIIGCGKIGLGGHARGYRSVPGVSVVAAADPTPERLALAQSELGLGAEDCYRDYRALLDRRDVDAVSVTTPQSARAPIVVAACQAGKHVLSEKPLATTLADADAMIAAAKQHGVHLATVHNYLFFPEYRTIVDLIGAGEIGDVEAVILNWLGVDDLPGSAEYRPRWRHDVAASGGGVLMDMLHCVYVASWLVGSPIRKVSALVDKRIEPEGTVEDAAYCRFEHEKGISLVNVAWGKGPGSTEIMGTHGRILQFNASFGTTPFTGHEQLHLVNERGATAIEVTYERRPNSIYANFADCVREGQQPVATGEDGKAVLEAVLGVYASAALGREVRLPFSTDDPVYLRGALGIRELPLAEDSRVVTRRIFGV